MVLAVNNDADKDGHLSQNNKDSLPNSSTLFLSKKLDYIAARLLGDADYGYANMR